MSRNILAYITADKERIVGGEPLTILSADDGERGGGEVLGRGHGPFHHAARPAERTTMVG